MEEKDVPQNMQNIKSYSVIFPAAAHHCNFGAVNFFNFTQAQQPSYIYSMNVNPSLANMVIHMFIAALLFGLQWVTAQVTAPDPKWQASNAGDWGILGECIIIWNGCVSGGYNPGQY